MFKFIPLAMCFPRKLLALAAMAAMVSPSQGFSMHTYDIRHLKLASNPCGLSSSSMCAESMRRVN